MTTQTAVPPLPAPGRRPRTKLRLLGLAAAHLVLGLLWVLVTMVVAFAAYGFGPSPAPLGDAIGAAVVGWLVAGTAAVWLWATRRRLPFLVPVAWFALATALIVAVCAVVPDAPCSDLFC